MQWLVYSVGALALLLGIVTPGGIYEGVESIVIDNTYLINDDGELTFNESTLNASAGDLLYYDINVTDINVTLNIRKG